MSLRVSLLSTSEGQRLHRAARTPARFSRDDDEARRVHVRKFGHPGDDILEQRPDGAVEVWTLSQSKTDSRRKNQGTGTAVASESAHGFSDSPRRPLGVHAHGGMSERASLGQRLSGGARAQ